jgi:hypothetical protein
MSEQSTLARENEQVVYRDLTPLGFPGYRVGDDGSVWSRWRKVPAGYRNGMKGVMGGEYRRMHLNAQKSGHLRIRLCPGRKRHLVHHLVLLAFVGPCPEGMECRHYPDRDPANNRLDNLQWGTRSQNQADRIEQGTDGRGERCVTAKLNDTSVIAMRREHAAGGVTFRSLAKKHKVSPDAVRDAINRRTWKHVAAHVGDTAKAATAVEGRA